METLGAQLECDTCGGTDFYKESGHFYCNECQTQSQQVQEHIFEQDTELKTKSAKVIKTQNIAHSNEQLTSWESCNYVLKGLTEELLNLGARPELKSVVKCLWMKYLHKCEVFDVNSNRGPKLSVLNPRKDIAVLCNVKKRRRRRTSTSSTASNVSVFRERSKKKRALISSHYKEMSQSYTQDSVASESLASIKSDLDASVISVTSLGYNKLSIKNMKQVMSKQHMQEHLNDIDCDMNCHKAKKTFKHSFYLGPTNLTLSTLYNILYIGLRIVDDPIQLGDLLRFIREGHVSFRSYRHFFPENLSAKAINLPQRLEILFTFSWFRKRSAKLAHFLEVTAYIVTPDLGNLCSRYCEELNLPKAAANCCNILIEKTLPKLKFTEKSKNFPNYEARAMSFIIFVLKLLYGLDGKTEHQLANYAECINFKEKMFSIVRWLEFICYRSHLMSLHHLPSAIRDFSSLDSDLYINYLEKQQIAFKGTPKSIHSEVKDYLQVLEKLSEDLPTCREAPFEPSLTPLLHYTKKFRSSHSNKILFEDFSNNSLEFLLRPNKFLTLVGCTKVRHGGSNDDIVLQEKLHQYKAARAEATLTRRMKFVAVKVCGDIDNDQFIGEYFESQEKTLKPTDTGVFLSNWEEGHQKDFTRNKELLHTCSESVKLSSKVRFKKGYPEHFQHFERYWMNVPSNTMLKYVTKREMSNFQLPVSFKTVLLHCGRVIEQNTNELYSEFLAVEMYVSNYKEVMKKSKGKEKSNTVIELRNFLNSVVNTW